MLNIGDKFEAAINHNNIIEIVWISHDKIECLQTISGRKEEENLLLTEEELSKYWKPLTPKKSDKFNIGDICMMQMEMMGKTKRFVVSVEKKLEDDNKYQYLVEPGDIELREFLYLMKQTTLFEAMESELTPLTPMKVVSQTMISDLSMLCELEDNKFIIFQLEVSKDLFVGKEEINKSVPDTSELN